MTTIDSSSAAESGHTSMGDSSEDYQYQDLDQQQHRNQQQRQGTLLLGRRRRGRRVRESEEEEEEEEENECGVGDGAAVNEESRQQLWESFSNSFRQVQTVLDQNRVLIAQVNENHQSKIPENLTKNVSLIREINSNVSKVVSLYSDLSAKFADLFHHELCDNTNINNKA